MTMAAVNNRIELGGTVFTILNPHDLVVSQDQYDQAQLDWGTDAWQQYTNGFDSIYMYKMANGINLFALDENANDLYLTVDTCDIQDYITAYTSPLCQDIFSGCIS